MRKAVQHLAMTLLLLGSWAVFGGQLATPNFQEDQSVFRAYIDSTRQYLGGTVELVVERKREADLQFALDTIPHFEIIGRSSDTSDLWIRDRFTLLAVDTGSFDLPTLTSTAGSSTYQSFPGNILVQLMPGREGTELVEARPNRTVDFNLWWWLQEFWYYILIGAVVGVLVVWAIRKWKRGGSKAVAEEAPVPLVDPFEEAMHAIDRLRKERPWEVDAKVYYVELGDLIRRYLETTTGLPLMELTTAEAIVLVNNRWTGSQIESYEYLLTRADVVKFAKGSWDVSVHMDCLTKAEQLIIEFKPRVAHG